MLVPWLLYFAEHGTGRCTVATGCDGPDSLNAAFPGGAWDPLNWPLVLAGMVTFFIVATGPATPLVLGGISVTVAALRRVTHRKATLAGGVLMLALGLWQLTTIGGMITAWVVD